MKIILLMLLVVLIGCSEAIPVQTETQALCDGEIYADTLLSGITYHEGCPSGFVAVLTTPCDTIFTLSDSTTGSYYFLRQPCEGTCNVVFFGIIESKPYWFVSYINQTIHVDYSQ